MGLHSRSETAAARGHETGSKLVASIHSPERKEAWELKHEWAGKRLEVVRIGVEEGWENQACTCVCLYLFLCMLCVCVCACSACVRIYGIGLCARVWVRMHVIVWKWVCAHTPESARATNDKLLLFGGAIKGSGFHLIVIQPIRAVWDVIQIPITKTPLMWISLGMPSAKMMCACACLPVYARVCLCACVLVHVHAHMLVCTCLLAWQCGYAWGLPVCACACVCTCLLECACACACACACSCVCDCVGVFVGVCECDYYIAADFMPLAVCVLMHLISLWHRYPSRRYTERWLRTCCCGAAGGIMKWRLSRVQNGYGVCKW